MPNDDYILRSDALKAVCETCSEHGENGEPCAGHCGDYALIKNIPAADVELTRYAEWISPDGISVCSECGKAAPYDVEGDVIMYWPNLNFCPNCGCRMNVEGKDAV